MLQEAVEKIRALEKEYQTIKTLKSSALGMTMLAMDSRGCMFIKKVIPLVDTVYVQLKEMHAEGVPQVVEAVEAPNYGFRFCDVDGKETRQPLLTYVIERFINGETLQQQLDRGKVFTEPEVEKLFKQVAQILVPLHKRFIVHRDIKPDNIIVDEQGKLYLIDFGAARSFARNEKKADTVLLGTREFAAPEQFGVKPTDARTDIYVLGNVIANLLPRDYNGYLKPVLDLCLEFDPNRRLASAELLLELLEHPTDRLAYVRSKAASGDAAAWTELGHIYKAGVLVLKNMQEAMACYAHAAARDDANGMYYLGEFYECGICTELDKAKAVDLYRKSAAKNNELAFQKLGWLYYAGYGVVKDYNTAVYYFNQAVKSEIPFADASASYGIAVCLLNGNGLPQDVSKALEIIDSLATSGAGVGLYGLANIYEVGQYRAKDLPKAFELYKKAVEAHYLQALAQVGKCYYYGLGVQQDYAQALYYFTQALHQNDKVAKAYLAIMYVYEDGVEQDCQKAYQLCRESAEQGNNVACYFLGNYFYKYGVIVEKNDRERFRWYKKAADNGYKDALNALGDCYAEGIGTTRSMDKAMECYNMARRADKAQALALKMQATGIT